MNKTFKGVLQFLLVAVLIAAFAFVAFKGVGKEQKGLAKHILLGLDLKGGVSVTYQAKGDTPSEQVMTDTVYKLRQRVDGMGYTEANVYKEGDNRINIDVPGATNAKQILDELGKPGALYFILYKNLKGKDGSANPADGAEVTYEQKDIEMDGSTITEAKQTTQNNQNTGASQVVVQLKFGGKGVKKFAKITSENVGEQLAIVYDNKLVSAPTLKSAIEGGDCVIEMGTSDTRTKEQVVEEARNIATYLRNGALKVELENIHDNVVGATLGSEALSSSLLAGVIGLILVIIFMIIVYRLPGLAAAIALVFYTLAMLLVLNFLDVQLTLPGIAGIILSVGMAVDANCIIFTRMKEELAQGKTVSTAIKNGFSKAASAIIDGNVTTIIAALVLWFKGTGTVKGFATTLAIGIILSMFTAFVITWLLLKAFVAFGLTNTKLYGVKKDREAIDFVGKGKIYAIVSGLCILLCIGGGIFNKASSGEVFNYSLDFVGGTSTSVSLDAGTDADAEKENALKIVEQATGKRGEVATADDKGIKKITVRTTALSNEEANDVRTKLAEKYTNKDVSKVESETISASVSDEMKTDAVVATLIAALCMLIYIWIRFRNLASGASAVIALVHDILVVVAVYVLAKNFIQVGSTFIACMLTIVGYSINDTIVVFDRIRENQNKGSRKDMKTIINKSITETLSRSISTSVTTLIMILVLAIVGVSSVREFAIPLLIGVICGCYSSICVASPIWYLLSGKGEKTKKAVTYSKPSKK